MMRDAGFVVLAAALYTGCSASQLQNVAHYADAGAKLLDIGARVTEAISSAKKSGAPTKEAVVEAAVDNAGRLTSMALDLLADGKRNEAREKLVEAVSMLQGVRDFLPEDARKLLKQAESALVGIAVEDLKRVYELGDE